YEKRKVLKSYTITINVKARQEYSCGLYCYYFDFFFILLIHINTPVTGKEVATILAKKYRNLVKGPYTSPICNALMEDPIRLRRLFSRKISLSNTSPEY